MTPYKASKIRLRKITGLEPSNVERRQQQKAAKLAEEGRWTFGRLWSEWKTDPENKDKRGTFKADYRYKKHIENVFGDREPKDISVLDIDRLRIAMSKTHAKETTRSVISLVSRIANYGAKRELCPGLPFRIDLKKKQLGREPKHKRVPGDEQIREYVKKAREWHDKQIGDLVLLEYYTGMRRGSAWRLKWEDVRLKEKRTPSREDEGRIGRTDPDMRRPCRNPGESSPHGG
jgi:integrase